MSALGPYCDLCATRAPCERAARVLPSYPACRAFLRDTPLERMAALFARLAERHTVEDPRLAAVLERLLGRFDRDRTRFSEILEPSACWERGRWHMMRLSYAFPGFREDPRGTMDDIVALLAPFGASLQGWGRALCEPLGERCVNKPLFGLAYDDPERWRLKVYVEFVDDAGSAALVLAERIIGCRGLADRFGPRTLHLLGIDLGPRGIVGAKLYFHVPSASFASLQAHGPVELFDQLAARGLTQLLNPLVIHRFTVPDDPHGLDPAEIDFALAENGLLWRDLQDCPPLARIRRPADPLAAVEQAFRLGFRRISVPVGRTDKLNAYYVLAESNTG